MDNLKISSTNNAKLQLFHISGAINSYTFTEFETKIFDAIKKSDGVLMSANEEGEELGHNIYIMQPSNAVKLAIDFTGFSEMFNFINSIDEVNH